jgi:hypothetical protein
MPGRGLTHIESTLPPATLKSPDNKRREGAAAMKQQAIQYVALDVHQAALVVSVRDEQGSSVMRATVATEAKAIVGLVRGLGARVHIAFEERTQAQWLHDVLQPHAERVIVCNTRGSGESSNKSDRVDADRLWRSQRGVPRREGATDAQEAREELPRAGRKTARA